jgi:serine/threonine protein kinase
MKLPNGEPDQNQRSNLQASEQPLILNRYRLQETRGQGGFARVDIALDTFLQRRVALKRIPLTVSERDLAGLKEARTVAMLDDPHVVTLYELELTGTEAILVMELVDGPTLAELMAAQSELLDLDIASALIYDIAQGLEYAHENQVLHLDVKPANILINRRGNAKISDLGISQLSSSTGFGEPLGGTIGYMPPEQIEQTEVDQRTDIWALAALTYQLLCGINPFFAETPEQSLEQIIYSPIPLPTILRPELDFDIDQILVSALNAEKDERISSVKLFWRELAPHLGKVQQGRKKLRQAILRMRAEADPEADILAAQMWQSSNFPEPDDFSDNTGTSSDGFFDNGYDTGYSSNYDAKNNAKCNGSSSEKNRHTTNFADSQADYPVNETSANAERSQKQNKQVAEYTQGFGVWAKLPRRLQEVFARIPVAVGSASCVMLVFNSLVHPFWLEQSSSLAPAVSAPLSPAFQSAWPFSGEFWLLQLITIIITFFFAAFLPRIGAALAILALSAATIICGYMLLGLGMLCGLAIWWIFCGRKDKFGSTILSLAPLIAAVGLPFLLPLLAAAFLPWRRALATTTACLLLLAALSVVTAPVTLLESLLKLDLPAYLSATLVISVPVSTDAFADIIAIKPYLLAFSDPYFWLTLIVFTIATIILTLFCNRATRVSCMAGTLSATVIMVAGIILPTGWSAFSAHSFYLPGEVISIALSGILLILLAIIGIAPARAVASSVTVSSEGKKRFGR